jgi:hypothetical protein
VGPVLQQLCLENNQLAFLFCLFEATIFVFVGVKQLPVSELLEEKCEKD